MGYVCAFRGRRDSYQVPLALAEAGRLEKFITDQYLGLPEKLVAGLLPHRLAESVRGRFEPGLPAAQVKRLGFVAAAEAVSRLAKVPSAYAYEIFDPQYGNAAAREARKSRSDLFMYSSHAHEAFSARYNHTPHKVLFQFHPHYMLENAILERDRKESARAGITFESSFENLPNGPNGIRHRGDTAWQLADQIVCASSFTKASLTAAGADPSRIVVVPYGVPLGAPQEQNVHRDQPDQFHALFVGSGLQRKGLHHLLLAWQRARLPAGARLTVVSRVMDPGLAPLLKATRDVCFHPGLSGHKLRQLYSAATVLVMPSLVEGFGQVYLEALASGLPVLGTPNTCCPDLGSEEDGVFISPPGHVEELTARVENLSRSLVGNAAVKVRAKERAARFTWDSFRHGIQTATQEGAKARL